jgi:hypothetical protein
LGHDNILEEAIISGAGAVIGECAAEALADRDQLMREAMRESQTPGQPFDEKAFNEAYREKLQPYIDAGRLIAGSVIAATGRDPTLAIASATNALENNFAGLPEYPEELEEVMGEAGVMLKDAAVDTAIDAYNNPDEYIEAAVVGTVPYGDIAQQYYLGETVTKYDLAVETLVVASGMKTVKGGGRLGLKAAKKFGTNFIKRAEEAGHLRKVAANRNTPNRTLDGLDLAGFAEQRLIGEYRHVRGHHVHAKKAFEGHANYDPQKGFSISYQMMENLGIDHDVVTVTQRKLFSELAKSGRQNTMKEHTKIAVEALTRGGCQSRETARDIVAESLKQLRKANIRQPGTIPWHGKK